MSRENIPAFFDAVKNSPELQQRVGEIQAEAARLSANRMAELSTEAGTPFTAEEFLARGEGELSEMEMDAVAGGARRPQQQWT